MYAIKSGGKVVGYSDTVVYVRLHNLHQAFVRCPVVMFFPGTYNEQELILFNEIKDDNYYRAFRLVK